MDVNEELAGLNAAIDETPGNAGLHITRAKYYYKNGDFGSALNDFLRAAEIDSDNAEAREYIKMINEILEFRHKDLLNP